MERGEKMEEGMNTYESNCEQNTFDICTLNSQQSINANINTIS